MGEGGRKGFTALAILVLHVAITESRAGELYCYQCEECPKGNLQPLRHLKKCPDESYVSCLVTITRFAEYSTVSRGCSKAPAIPDRALRTEFTYTNSLCTHHSVNMIKAIVCLCTEDGCNGRGLPSKETIRKSQKMSADEVTDENGIIITTLPPISLESSWDSQLMPDAVTASAHAKTSSLRWILLLIVCHAF